MFLASFFLGASGLARWYEESINLAGAAKKLSDTGSERNQWSQLHRKGATLKDRSRLYQAIDQASFAPDNEINIQVLVETDKHSKHTIFRVE